MRRILAFLCICLATCIGNAFALTLGEIKVDVRRLVDDQADPKITYTNDFLTDLINEGHRDFVNQTWALMVQASQTLATGTTYYDLRSDAFAIRMVRYRNASGVITELSEMSERALVQQNPDYERQTGAPSSYFVRYSTSGASALEIGFVPRPNVTGTILIDYYIQAPTLSADADIPFASYRILYPYHEALVYYTVARIATLENQPAAAGYYTQLYLNAVKTATDRLGRMPNYNPGFSAGSK